jgi:hypothetical protein
MAESLQHERKERPCASDVEQRGPSLSKHTNVQTFNELFTATISASKSVPMNRKITTRAHLLNKCMKLTPIVNSIE